MTAPITIRPYQPGDEHSLLRGYGQIFAERSLAHWNWKFKDNPTGLNHTMLAHHEQEGVVGAYVTIPVHAAIEQERRVIGQLVDMWVLPQHRRFGPRPGMYVNLGLAHYDAWGGRAPEQESFHHGWPTRPTWGIGHKYLRYEMVRDVNFLFREVPPGGFEARPAPTDLAVARVSRFSADTDTLWSEFQPGTQLAIIRDRAYLNWRYADAVDTDYELYECRETSTGKLRGISVTTHRDFVVPNTCFLVDWVAQADDLDTTQAMIGSAEARASQLGASALATLFPQRDARFLSFQKLGFLVYGTNYWHMVIPFDRHDTFFYKEEWYSTLGDVDLV